jgi:hypothetical protein
VISMIKTLITMGSALLLMVASFNSSLAADADAGSKFTMPSADVLSTIAEDPQKLASVLANASETQVAAVLEGVIGIMNQSDDSASVQATRLGVLLNQVTAASGSTIGDAMAARFGGSPTAAAKSAFVMPSKSELKGIISDPKSIASVLEGASEADVAAVMIAAIGVMESMNMPEATIAANLNVMLNTISAQRGDAFGAAVMARIRKKVNPRLLPVIPFGSGTSGGGGRYPRQSTTK